MKTLTSSKLTADAATIINQVTTEEELNLIWSVLKNRYNSIRGVKTLLNKASIGKDSVVSWEHSGVTRQGKVLKINRTTATCITTDSDTNFAWNVPLSLLTLL